MSFSTASSGGPFCGCVGCTEPASVVIDHETHGRRVACDDCAAGHEVIQDV